MSKFLAIGLSVVILFQGLRLDVGDLAHMDELLEHARFHADKYGDNFFVFLSKHYGELQEEHTQDHQEEQKEHEKLPFNNTYCSHVLTVYVVNRFEMKVNMATPEVDYTTNFLYLDNYVFLEKTDIFQPPQLA